jgi:uncharacterized membrane protein
VGQQRTPVQDIEFAVRQLVEVAVRALSPGVNDPFTAVSCVDRLGSALCRVAQREFPSPYRQDEQGILRVVAPATTFRAMADVAFNDIRAYARSSATVTIRLLHTITTVAAFARRHGDRGVLREHAQMIARGSEEGLPETNDRRAVAAELRLAMRALESTGEDTQSVAMRHHPEARA